MTTMSDVAKRAGVATSTVSHVINRTRHVSEATIAVVERAMEDAGYIHNALARSLARSTTNTVGLALSSHSNIYFSDLIEAVESACARLGLMVFLADTSDDPDKELQIVRALHQRRVDGLIFAPSADPEQRALGYLRKNEVPCVVLDRLVCSEFDQVGVENVEAMAALAAHLAGHGHRRIALLSNQAGFATTLERIEGYRLGLARCGLGFDAGLLEMGSADRAANVRATFRLLDRANPPTAIIGGNNLSTISVMQALRERKLRIPQDMALAGFDDFDWADLFEPHLTVIAQPCGRIGETAARMLVERLKTPNRPRETIRLAPTLVIRGSCGCA